MSRRKWNVKGEPPSLARTTLTVSLLVALALVFTDRAHSHGTSLDDWAVERGVSLQIDSSGFDLPTAIAFVPDPGPAPDDPLYFVTELEGEIKVVTKDRTVHTFASIATRELPRRDLRGAGQAGLAGMCLDAEAGRVFVTYTYADDGGVLRNGVARFDTEEPGLFALSPMSKSTFEGIFAHAQSAPAHQIGHCVVDDERVYIGLGDGGNVAAARDLDVLLGKVVCMAVDGAPCSDNPFLESRPSPEPRDFVYAYGFRNPFGLAMAEGVLFAAENGIRTDRILRVVKGADHYWDGSDDSIAAGAELLLTPAPSPVQLGYVAEEAPGLPAKGTFVFAVFHQSPHPGVMAFEYDFEHMRTSSAPRFLLQYTGERDQRVIAAAVGPDGIYTASALPDQQGTSRVLRLSYDAPNEHTHLIGLADEDSAAGVLAAYSCISCHSIDGEGGGIAPSLDGFGLRWRLTQRLNSPGYEEQVRRVDQLEGEPFVSFRTARQEVLAAEGIERTAVWLEHFLAEPRFDNPDTQMPNMNLSSNDIAQLTEVLSREIGIADISLLERFASFVMRNRREVGVGYVLGAVSVLGLVAVWQITRLLRRVHRSRKQSGIDSLV